MKPLNQFQLKKAAKHLARSDRALLPLIKKHEPCALTITLGNPFHVLASSIVSQQLSAHAASAIKGRLFELIGANHFTPENLSKISLKDSRETGLSKAKLTYIQGLAAAATKGDLDFPSILKREDEEVVAKLTSFPGIGRWTAEMFLIFGLGRPDVLSVSDAGLRRAFKLIYKLPDLPSPSEMLSISESWRPYRSVGSWYLWRAID